MPTGMTPVTSHSRSSKFGTIAYIDAPITSIPETNHAVMCFPMPDGWRVANDADCGVATKWKYLHWSTDIGEYVWMDCEQTEECNQPLGHLANLIIVPEKEPVRILIGDKEIDISEETADKIREAMK